MLVGNAKNRNKPPKFNIVNSFFSYFHILAAILSRSAWKASPILVKENLFLEKYFQGCGCHVITNHMSKKWLEKTSRNNVLENLF